MSRRKKKRCPRMIDLRTLRIFGNFWWRGKKGKKEKQREIALEKFLKWFKGEEESRSGIGRREKLWKRRWVLAVYVVTIFSRENLARIGRLSNPRVLKTLFCSVLLHLGRGMLLEIWESFLYLESRRGRRRKKNSVDIITERYPFVEFNNRNEEKDV